MVKSGKSDKRPGPLAQSPSHLMHRVLQLALDIYSEEAGAEGPTQRQFAVLEAVAAQPGLTQTDLVRATGIDRSTLADLVTRMTAKGLLAREKSTVDARAKAVRLAEAGEAMLTSARPRVEAADRRIMALLPKGKRDGFIDLLAELANRADAAPDLAKAEAKAEKKAAKEARRADKAAQKAALKAEHVARKAEKAARKAKADTVADADGPKPEPDAS